MAVAKRTDRDIPDEWRDSVARHLATWVEGQPRGRRSDRAIAEMLGVSNFTYNRLKNRTGPLGLHVLVRLREVLGLSLDELLGLTEKRAPVPAPADDLEGIRRLLREELRRVREEEAKGEPADEKPKPAVNRSAGRHRVRERGE